MCIIQSLFSAGVKIENFIRKILIILAFLLKTKIVGRGGSYPQSMFWIKTKKTYIPLHTPVLLPYSF